MSDITVAKTPLMQAEEAPGFPVAGGVRARKTGPMIPGVPNSMCAAVGVPARPPTAIPKQTEVAVGKMIVAEIAGRDVPGKGLCHSG